MANYYSIILDRKFAFKSRLTGSLQITMDVIKQNANNFKVLHPALLVIKLSAGSSKAQKCLSVKFINGNVVSFLMFDPFSRVKVLILL